jgi:hypothetical protein
MLRIGVPGQPPRDVTRIGTFYPRGFNSGGPGVAACSVQHDLAIVGQSGGQGIGTVFYSAVQLSTGKVLWAHKPIPSAVGVVEVVASRDARFVAENHADQSGASSATIYGADGAVVGNPHLRRVLVEASWSYRHRPALTKNFKQRSQGLPPDVVAYAWAAQLRLSSRYRKLAVAKGHNKAVVAVARELAGFVWGLMNDRTNVN